MREDISNVPTCHSVLEILVEERGDGSLGLTARAMWGKLLLNILGCFSGAETSEIIPSCCSRSGQVRSGQFKVPETDRG